MWPERHDLIAIDGKTSRRSHDKRKGLKALHILSAYATNARLTLAQMSVPEKTNEITAIPELLDRLAEKGQLEGALVTIDAMGCQVEIADKIVAHKADFLLALKGNQSTLEKEVAEYFRTAPDSELIRKTTVEKGHGRIETRLYTASSRVEWMTADKSYPGAPRFGHVRTILQVVNRTEYPDHCTVDTRLFLSSASLDIGRLSDGARGHWGVESMHWLLESSLRMTSPATAAATAPKTWPLSRFALGLVRANKTKGSVKTKRKSAGWNTDFLMESCR